MLGNTRGFAPTCLIDLTDVAATLNRLAVSSTDDTRLWLAAEVVAATVQVRRVGREVGVEALQETVGPAQHAACWAEEESCASRYLSIAE